MVPRNILAQQLQAICMDFFATKNEFSGDAQSIQVMTYQTLENMLISEQEIKDFSTVVCDEAHYFLEDSLFNPNTQLSFDWLCDFIVQRQGLAVCVSATLDDFKMKLVSELELDSVTGQVQSRVIKSHKTGQMVAALVERKPFYGRYWDYVFDRDDSGFEITVRYLVSEQETIDILKEAKGKRLCFVSSKDRAERILEALVEAKIDASFVSSENKNSEGVEIVSSLVRENKFSAAVLLATSVLDVGVNIKDGEISTIILDTFDRTCFLQMLGRIRMKPEQEINVYIYRRDVKYFRNCKEMLRPRLQFQMDMAAVPDGYLSSKLVRGLLQEESFIDRQAVYFVKGRPHLNKLTRVKLQQQFRDLNCTLEGLEGDAEYHLKEQLGWLGMEDTFSVQYYASVEIRERRRQEVIAAIRKIWQLSPKDGISKQEASEKLKAIKEEVRNLDKHYIRSNENLSVERFRVICQQERLPFNILQKEVNRKQTYWLVETSLGEEADC